MRDRFRCLACGRSPATHLNVELHADHILAVANDGKTTLENLQTLCQDCNLGKGRTVLI
jgi:5-methylcytosine-specific restriction endonuclease McrA